MRLPDLGRDERAIFPEKIPAVVQTNGRWRYSWIEQVDNPGTGYADGNPARTGDGTYGTAFEVNNDGTITAGTIVWMRLRSGADGSLCYEFQAGGSGGGGPGTG